MIIGSIVTVAFDAGSTLLTDPIQRVYCRCDGRYLSQTIYSKLYEYIGDRYSDGAVPANQFRIPDLQGAFLKGADPNASVDIDAATRTIDGPGVTSSDAGTLQNKSLFLHRHNVAVSGGGPNLMSRLIASPDQSTLIAPQCHANYTDPRMPTYPLLTSDSGTLGGAISSGILDGGPNATLAPVNIVCDYLIRIL